MAIITNSDLRDLRTFQNDLMENECRILRYGEQVLNEVTGVSEYGTPEVIYEGPCRISTARGPRIITAGEGYFYLQSTSVFIRWDSDMPQAEDVVLITASPDPALVDRAFTVEDVERTQYVTARKLTCVGTENPR